MMYGGGNTVGDLIRILFLKAERTSGILCTVSSWMHHRVNSEYMCNVYETFLNRHKIFFRGKLSLEEGKKATLRNYYTRETFDVKYCK